MTDREQEDPVAEDIAERRPETDDIVAGEQVLDGDVETGQRPVAPHPDDFRGEGAAPKHRQETPHRDAGSVPTGSGGSTQAAASTEQERDRAERHA